MKYLTTLTFGFSIAVLAALSGADVLQIPYTSGKFVQSVVIPVETTDTVKFGNHFSLRFYTQSSGILVCGAQSSRLIEVITPGNARLWIQDDTNWMAASTYPADSLTRPLDSMLASSAIPPAGSSSGRKVPAHLYGWFGQFNDCTGARWSFDAAYQRVIFVQSGSVRAKLKIVGHVSRDESVSPLNQYYYLTSITLRIVANTNANDLVDPNPPASLRGPYRKGYSRAGHDLYNPLGIRLNRSPGRFQPGLRAPR